MPNLRREMFESIFPSRYLTFTIPNPTKPDGLLRFAVLDSPSPPTVSSVAQERSQVAALFVPKGRESDWIFSTESGHLQLLYNFVPPILRLIVVGENDISGQGRRTACVYIPNETSVIQTLVDSLSPFFMLLSPKVIDDDCKVHDVSVVDYEDRLVSSLVLERCVGDFVGEMLVEDVEIETAKGSVGEPRTTEFRRRLRFKRMPNLVQTEIRIVSGPEERWKFTIDLEHLAYLVPMVAAISLIGEWIDYLMQGGFKPKGLCLGVGGGALPCFLSSRLGFEVVGVEIDQEVVRIATEYFGLGECGIRVCIAEALEFVTDFPKRNPGVNFDVVILDLDCSDPGASSCAPPSEFATENFLMAARAILSASGIFAVNVIAVYPQFLDSLIIEFRKVFDELHKIDVDDTEHVVLVAKMITGIPSVQPKGDSAFVETLRDSISGKYLDSIRKIC